jgi:hypothetical protein
VYVIEILERCATLESRIARVYRHLAEQVHSDPGAARLWRALALEQETHADVLQRELRSFEEEDDSGAFLPEYQSRLARLDDVLQGIEARARGVQTVDDALATAVALEQSELEDIYDDVVLQSQPAFKLVSERIEAALNSNPTGVRSSLQPTPPKRRPSRRS